MKWSFILVALSFSVASFADNPAWYDEELLHNTVHTLEELMETPRVFTFQSEDTPEFKVAFKVLQKAVTNVHDQLEDHKGLEAVLKAAAELEAPVQAFMVASRQNQLHAGKRNLHLDDVLSIVGVHAELKFWVTPTP